MRTEKQREASRNNGRHSRGPITPEGKARSAQNATKHGVYAKALILPNESEAHFQEFAEILLHDLAPATGFEKELALEVVSCRWRMRRAWAAETGNIGFQMEAMAPKIAKACSHIEEPVRIGAAMRDLNDSSRTLNGFRRYETSLARQAHEAEKRLAALQKERLAAEPVVDDPPVPEKSPDRPQLPVNNDPGPKLTPISSTPPSTPNSPQRDKAA